MVDGLQFLDEHRLGILYVTERDGALTEEAVGHHTVDKLVDQLSYGLLGIVGQRARGSLHGIGHHQDGLLLGEGIGAGIGEEQVVDRLIGMLVLVLNIEVFGLALSVVGGYEVSDLYGQVVLVGQFQALSHMTDNHLSAFDAGELVVGVDDHPTGSL